jgi:hypothetical protein
MKRNPSSSLKTQNLSRLRRTGRVRVLIKSTHLEMSLGSHYCADFWIVGDEVGDLEWA